MKNLTLLFTLTSPKNALMWYSKSYLNFLQFDTHIVFFKTFSVPYFCYLFQKKFSRFTRTKSWSSPKKYHLLYFSNVAALPAQFTINSRHLISILFYPHRLSFELVGFHVLLYRTTLSYETSSYIFNITKYLSMYSAFCNVF